MAIPLAGSQYVILQNYDLYSVLLKSGEYMDTIKGNLTLDEAIELATRLNKSLSTT